MANVETQTLTLKGFDIMGVGLVAIMFSHPLVFLLFLAGGIFALRFIYKEHFSEPYSISNKRSSSSSCDCGRCAGCWEWKRK